WPVRSVVEVEYPGGADSLVASSDDATVPVQAVRSTTIAGRRRLAVPVDLPPLGYRLYRLSPGSAGAALDGLENEHLRAVVDVQTGWLSSLVHKPSGIELIDAQAAAA